MDSEQIIRIALTIVTPILTAGIGIVALVVGDWRERRTQEGRRKLAFEDASRQVEFASDWFNASKLITPDAEQAAAAQARTWLDEASDLVDEWKPTPRAEEERSVTARRLLLAYPMQRRGARVLRAFYYVFLGVVVFQVSGAMASAFGREDTLGVPNYFSSGLIYADLLGIILYTVIAMGFRFWALRVEEAHAADESQGRMTLRNVLLLYPFTGVRARVARAVYWLWTLLTVLVAVAVAISAVEDVRILPANLIALVAWIGWAVGIRYWAESHNVRARQRAAA
jgi:hypothetical protein